MPNNPKPITSEKEAVEILQDKILKEYAKILPAHDHYSGVHIYKERRMKLSDEEINTLFYFVKDAIATAYSQGEQATAKTILDSFEEKPGQPGWCREFNERFVSWIKAKYLSGEDKTEEICDCECHDGSLDCEEICNTCRG